MKIAPKLDIENLVPIEEILGGGAEVACAVDAVTDEDLAAVGLDVPDEADDALVELPVDEVVAEEDEEEADVEVLDELEVEVTVEVIVKRPEKLMSVLPAEILIV